ncbi:MAG: glycosyltransferase [candidate division Zixibacteria bacterium]|nr:glycosyltransferase [candidate division Zixibacteria bacterium]
MSQLKNNPRISVIVPAYNEEGNVDELCRQFKEMGDNVSFSFEVIIIDDGSTDSTAVKLNALVDNYSFLQIVSHGNNRGLTEALQTGFDMALGDIFVFYPADLQYKPEDIPAMISKIDEGNDLVTGWKQGKYSKRFVSKVYNTLSRRLFNLKVHDLNSVKAFRRQVVEDIFLRKDWHRYLVALAVEQGYRVDEVKMPLYERYSGSSKFSGLARIPVGILDMLAVKSQLTLLRKPLLFFGIIGGFLIGSGILVGIVAMYLRFIMDIGLRPLLYLVILLMILGGLSFILGFLAEGLASIKEELSGVRHSIRRLELRQRDDKD